MEKEKAMPQSSSSSGESSGDEDENEQEFVRSDRKVQKVEQKADKDSESEEEEGDAEENHDDDDDEIDGTQRSKAVHTSSSEEKQPLHGERDNFEYDSETSSGSNGKPSKPSHTFVVLPPIVENGVRHTGKKAPTSELSSKSKQKPEASPRKGKDKASKRDRDGPLVAEKGSSKKQKKKSSDISGKNVEHVPMAKDNEKVSKDKNIPATTFEKKSDSKKPAIAELVSAQQSSAKKAEGTPAKKADEDSESEEEEGDAEESDDDDDDEIDATQRAKAVQTSSSEEQQPLHDERDFSEYDSDTSSDSNGKPSKPSHTFVVLPRKLENGVGHNGKKAATSQLSSKSKQKPEASPRKGKDKASKRDRDELLVPEKGSSKKQKRESSDISGKNVEHVPKAKDTEKVSKDKNIPATTFEKKGDSKKPAIAELVPAQQSSAKKTEGTPAKKAAEKGKNEKTSVKDADAELAKGSLSPVKHKLFTGKDELVFTTEILYDLQKGIEIPSKKSDGYWSELADRMDGSWSKEKLCDKLKRMKTRYGSMVEKFNNVGERKFRNAVDQELFAMWDQIWGNGDATKADDTDVVKSKSSKALAAASPVKGGKASRNRVAAPVQDVKVVMHELEVHKDNRDAPESEESNGGSDSPKKVLIIPPMEVDPKDAPANQIQVPEKNADNAMSRSVSEVQWALHKEVRATLAEIQESSRQTLKDWETKALAVVENAVKAVAHQARIMNVLGTGGFDGLCTPFRSPDMRDLQLSDGDEGLQQQWHDLQLKEIDVYRQRLELMQRECQLKQDQTKAQLHKKK